MYKIINLLIPHRVLTLLAGKIAFSKINWLKNSLIKLFIRAYKPRMEEAIYKNPEEYESFNDFFTRELIQRRFISKNKLEILSPVDGKISDYGLIDKKILIQAKNFNYSTSDLLQDKNIVEELNLKAFITLYLDPSDYHRIHAPASGKVLRTRYIPGELNSVNETSQKNIPYLYVKNERAWMEVKTDYFSYILVFVGASIVSGIIPFWHQKDNYQYNHILKSWELGPNNNQNIIDQTQYLGHFSFGSTVIMLISENIDLKRLERDRYKKKQRFGDVLIRFGSSLAAIKEKGE
tara:strand:- start:15943 stop:16818 length:876 start_codon:yes stop_codon:yes gene_type:complete